LIGWVIQARRPRTEPSKRAVLPLPEFGLILAADEGIFGAGYDGDVGAADKFEHAQRVGQLGFEPGIASQDGDAEHVALLGLDQQQHRLLVGACGSGGVLIDDDLALERSVFAPAQG